MMDRLAEKTTSGTVLVTGGAKGVGAAIVGALVHAGFDVDFTYRSSGEQALALAASYRPQGALCVGFHLI